GCPTAPIPSASSYPATASSAPTAASPAMPADSRASAGCSRTRASRGTPPGAEASPGGRLRRALQQLLARALDVDQRTRAQLTDLLGGVRREAAGPVAGVEVREHPVEDRSQGGVVQPRLRRAWYASQVVAAFGNGEEAGNRIAQRRHAARRPRAVGAVTAGALQRVVELRSADGTRRARGERQQERAGGHGRSHAFVAPPRTTATQPLPARPL